jgi:hypothetical protein
VHAYVDLVVQIGHYGPMAISIQVGKARLFPFTAVMSSGPPDTSLPATAETNQATKIKVAINPSNNRELGVLALAPTTGANATARVNSDKAATVAISVPAPTLDSVTMGTDGGEVDPPSWLTA